MRGVGQATAAITIVNALPTGTGAAAGILLPAHAELVLEGPRPESTGRLQILPPGSDTSVVRAAYAAAMRQLAPNEPRHGTLTIRSEIPAAVGLKSSSAVASAVALAVANATNSALTGFGAAAISAEAGREAGVSATGAYDDALAGTVGGAVVTDNLHDRLLGRRSIEPGLEVALWIPPGTHPPSPEAKARFAAVGDRARAPVDAALAGDLWGALDLNSEIVEEVLGYAYGELRGRLRELGAVASGASGLGPAFAAVAPHARIGPIASELARRPGRSLVIPFAPERDAGRNL